MPPPPPPPELAGKRCAWLVAGNTIVSCDDLNDPKQPMRCGLLRTFICLRFTDENQPTKEKDNPSTISSTWLGFCDTSLFTSNTGPQTHTIDHGSDAIIGKPAYEAIWQTRARCDSTTSRELIKTTGLVFGHVYNVGQDNRIAYLKLTEEFINSEGFSRGRWSTVF